MSTFEEVKRDCKRKGCLYEDPEFEASMDSIFPGKRPPRDFVWKRPYEIAGKDSVAHMVVDGAGRLDIKQGALGDCWLLAAISSLSQEEPLFKKVVPSDQDVNPNAPDYCGAVHFNFWLNGKWTDVVIDDRLPTYNDKLMFCHSEEKNEFWSALLEKAYAKAQGGSYEALKGGQTSEAMEDFSGGVAESIDLKKPPADLFKYMMKADRLNSLMGCSIKADPRQVEAKAALGLIKGHAYSVTSVQHVRYRDRYGSSEEAKLVRVRNPWGNEREWKGAWSDESDEWERVPSDEKQKIGLTFDDDGEFWMSFDDFTRYFTNLEICMLGPDSACGNEKKSWSARTEDGSWRKNWSAGGCRNFPDTFARNPQYRITLEDPDDDDEVDNCSFTVALMQINHRRKQQALTIGFAIYRLTEEVKNDSIIGKEFFLYNKSTARSPTFINSREVCGRFSLPPGDYVVIPSTFKPDEQGDFILRLFAEKPHQTSEMDAETTIADEAVKRPQITREQHSSLDAKFRNFFLGISGGDELIDAFELREILSKAFKEEIQGREFSLESARALISTVDEDVSGKMGYEEFKELWILIRKWKGIFNAYDVDKSGDMELAELRPALAKAGFRFSNKVLMSVAMRFNNKLGKISFDDFLQILARLRTLLSAFEKHKYGRQATFSLDQFVMATVLV